MPSAPRQVWGDLAATAFVEANVLFHALDQEARQDLLQLAQLEDFQPGELIAADGEDGRLYLIREGTAAALLSRSGLAVEVATLERNAIYGEGRVLGEVQPGALVARTPVSVVTFPAPVMAAMAERFPKVRRLLEAIRTARERDAASRLGT
jgi:signal-transduction protein with cAMP-binding, CBS, and nucleotidyltransferase domain